MSDVLAVDPVSVPRRTMIMLSIILGSTLYSTTLLIASTLLPVGLASCIGLYLSMRADPPRPDVRLDWIGFLSLSATISCLQLVLSRGQRLDWYESPEIWVETIGTVAAFYIFLAHSLTTA